MDAKNISKILESLESALYGFAISPLNKENKQGGYFTLLDKKSGHILVTAQIGKIPDDKYKKYHDFSIEKARRVFKTNRFTSYATRDEKKNQYGGAISTNDHIFSFSGLPELADEALMIYVTTKLEYQALEEEGRKNMSTLNFFAAYENRNNIFLSVFICS
jgi:hypothetical protein